MKIFYIKLFIFCCCLSALSYSETLSPLVRVHLYDFTFLNFSKGFNLHGSSFTVHTDQTKPLSLGFIQKFSLFYNDNQWVVYTGKEKLSFSGQRFFVSAQNLMWKDVKLPAQIQFLLGDNKKTSLIGLVPLEDYVKGVVVSEIPVQWPFEMIKAQSISVRSYVLSQMEHRKNSAFDVQSTVQDQVYCLERLTKLGQKWHERVNKAVRETQGQVLVKPNGSLLKAYYHADSAGYTVSPSEVWKGVQFDSGVIEENFFVKSPYDKWSYSISSKKLGELLKTHCRMKSIDRLRFYRASVSSRISHVVVIDKKNNCQIKGAEFRNLLGVGRFKSTLFSLNRKGDQWIFNGKGFGHGVGMSQWGGRQLALQGWQYSDILNFYYPKAILKQNYVYLKAD